MPFDSMIFGVAAGLAVLYALIYAPSERKSWHRSLIKTLSTLLLALFAHLQGVRGFEFITFALLLGAVGDYFLTRDGDRAFLTGLIAFAFGHAAYVIGFIWAASQMHFGGPSAWQAISMVGLLAAIASTEIWLSHRTGAYLWPVRIYVSIIGMMGLAALALPPGEAPKAALILWIGAALFILSDILLAIHIFITNRRSVLLGTLVWPTYWVGQAMILWGALHYWGALQG